MIVVDLPESKVAVPCVQLADACDETVCADEYAGYVAGADKVPELTDNATDLIRFFDLTIAADVTLFVFDPVVGLLAVKATVTVELMVFVMIAAPAEGTVKVTVGTVLEVKFTLDVFNV